MAGKAEFAVIDLGQLVWPVSLQIPANRFRLFVAADTIQTTTDEISEFAKAALHRGMVYFCAYGPGCQRLHDIVDEVIVEREVGERRIAATTAHDVVMTTWHDDETLEGALDFFATSALPTDGYAAGSSYRLIMCVGNPEWASIAMRFLKEAKFLV